jgi:osmotically inducible lipoprotein OsmB
LLDTVGAVLNDSFIHREIYGVIVMNRFTTSILASLLAVALCGCADMSSRQKSAAIGAGIGGVAGAVLTHGSAFGTVGGAAIGGVIGHGVDNLTGGNKKK